MKEGKASLIPIATVFILLLQVLLTFPPANAGIGSDGLGKGIGEREWSILGGDHFIENAGQWDEEVRFALDGPHGSTFFCRDAIFHDLRYGEGRHIVKISFDRPSKTAPEGLGELGFGTNYFLGNDPSRWIRDARSYEEVLYEDIWPDIDIRYRLRDGQLKYDVILDGSSDARMVRFLVEGHSGMALNERGLEITTMNGPSVLDSKPAAFYDGGRPVPVDFKLFDRLSFGFDVEKEAGRRLTIDPLLFSTVIGGSGGENPSDFEIDGDGEIYLYGSTFSKDFPNTTGSYDPTPNGYYSYIYDLYVTKMDKDCSNIIFSTFIGGWSCDVADDMDVDENEDIYLTGYTYNGEFPTTPGAFQRGNNGGSSLIFVTKLAANGSALVYSTFAAGNGINVGCAIKARNGQACVGGHALGYDFLTETGPVGGVHGYAIFFILDRNGSHMVDHLVLDGYYGDWFTDIELDGNDDVIIAGHTFSPMIPTTPTSVQYRGPNLQNAFVVKYRPEEKAMVFISEFGADGPTAIKGLRVDGKNNILFTGTTRTDGILPYPTTPGAIDTHRNGTDEVFVTKLDPNGTKLLFSSIIGGDGAGTGTGLDVDPAGNVFVVGRASDFYPVPGCDGASTHGGDDAFVMKVNSNSSSVLNLTFIGGSGPDGALWCRMRTKAELIMGGYKESADFPVLCNFSRLGETGVFVMGMIIGSRPSEPLGLKAREGDGSIVLEWEPPLDDGNSPITNYSIYRGTGPLDLERLSVIGPGLNHTDKCVLYGIVYYYAVSAANVHGYGPLNGTVSNVSTTLPSPPREVKAVSSIGFITITLKAPDFDGGTPVKGYSIYKNGGWFKDLRPDELELEDPDVGMGVHHVYWATAHNKNGESRPSISATVRSKTFPSPPLNLTCTRGPFFVDLRWEEPSDDGGLDIETYFIFRDALDGNRTIIGIRDYDTVFLRDDDVEPGRTYRYDVVASTKIGTSPPSSAFSVTAIGDAGPPTDLSAVSVTEGILVEWSYHRKKGSPDVLGFNIYEGSSAYSVSLILFSEGNATSFLHDGLVEDKVHYYQVEAVTAFGPSMRSETVSQRPGLRPSPPTGIEATSRPGAIELKWSPPQQLTTPPISSYLVERRPSGGSFTELARTGSSTFGLMDLDVGRGSLYTYRVMAENSISASPPGNEVSAMGQFPPDPPIELKAEASGRAVLLTWVAPEFDGGLAINAYLLFRTGPGGSPMMLDTIADGPLMYLDGTVLLGSEYSYHVECENDLGGSGPGNVVSVRLPGLPSAPLGLSGSIAGGKVVLTWQCPLEDGGCGIGLYRIYRMEGKSTSVPIGNTTDMSMIFIDGTVEDGRSYTYHVAAVNQLGEGDWSGGITVSTSRAERGGKPRIGLLDIAILCSVLFLVAMVLTALAMVRARRNGDVTVTELWEE